MSISFGLIVSTASFICLQFLVTSLGQDCRYLFPRPLGWQLERTMEQLMWLKIWAWEAGSLKYENKSAPANDVSQGAEIVVETNWNPGEQGWYHRHCLYALSQVSLAYINRFFCLLNRFLTSDNINSYISFNIYIACTVPGILTYDNNNH